MKHVREDRELEAYRAELHGWALQHGIDAASASDFVQTVLLIATKSMGSIEVANRRAWLFGIARKKHKHFRRSIARDGRRHEAYRDDPAARAENPVEATHRKAELHLLLAGLTTRERAAIWLTQLRDVTHHAAGEVLGLSKTAVSNLVQSGMSSLKSVVEERKRQRGQPQWKSFETS